MDNHPRYRLHLDADLEGGGEVLLGPQQAHRLLHVLRAEVGWSVALFNGRDGEWRAELVEAGKKRARMIVRERLRKQAAVPDLWLVFAPVKRAPLDLVVEKATELGVAALQPVFTRRTVVARLNDERLHAIAVEAAEQCGRLSVPAINPPRPLDDVLAAWPAGRPLVFFDETGAGRPVAEALGAIPRGPAALLIGPEGGFAKTELDGLRSLAFAVAASLGPRILRAETAALAALACYQALRGDWCSESVSSLQA